MSYPKVEFQSPRSYVFLKSTWIYWWSLQRKCKQSSKMCL